MSVEIREKFHSLAAKKNLLNEEEAIDLEKGIYNWCISYANEKGIAKNWKNPVFTQLYIDKSRSVLVNLDKNSYVGNMRLGERVKDKEFYPHDIAFMKPDNVFPESWRHLVDLKMKRDQQLGEVTMQPMTDQFKCGRCKQRKCVYYEKQTRSADEAMTIFVSCLNCNNSWKM